MKLKPEIRALVEWAAPYGWSLDGETGRNHPVLRHTSGAELTLPSTPSDWRGLANTRADIRRISGIPSDSGPAARYRHEPRRDRFDMDAAVREQRERRRREAEAEAEARPLRASLAVKLEALRCLDPRRHSQHARYLAADIVALQRQLKELGFDDN